MFFIKSQSPFRKKDIVLLHVVPTAFVVFILCATSVAGWMYAERSYNKERFTVVSEVNQSIAKKIQQRMLTYEDMLRTTASLFSVNNKPSAQDWHAYANSMDIMDRYPGTKGLGYAPYIRADNLSEFISEAHTTHSTSYNIFPKGERQVYTPIKYLEPPDSANKSTIGYDMFSEHARRSAMEKARDSGLPTLTSKTTLLQERMLSPNQPGFIMYHPVYKNGLIPVSEDERRASIQGFVYMPFRAYEFMAYVVNITDNRFTFTVTDEQTNTLLYSNNPDNAAVTNTNAVIAKDTVEIAQTQWVLTTSASKTISVAAIPLRPGAVLFIGVASSILMGSLMYLLIVNRSRSLAQTEEKRIREAKDELLALASHQLRTPATGVKQYIGMLKEGLAGKLTDTQRNIVEKAYQSNERQLSTINEMLFVARADAGYLKMDKRTFDFKQLVSEVIDEQRVAIKNKQLHLRTHIKEKTVKLEGDSFYLRMAVENILSNAIKYTPESGRIYVKLRKTQTSVRLTVQDTGVGVDAKDQALLFQKFSRIPNKMSSSTSGSGIGLYLVQSVIKNHNGSIQFTSQPGQGSTVEIVLPIHQNQNGNNLSST